MRHLLILALLCGACAPEPSRRFPVGVAGPLSARLRAEVLRLGFDAEEVAPAGAAVERAADEGEHTWPAGRLRLLAARAAQGSASGVFFLPPRLPEGVDWANYPEEWLSVVRVLREIRSLRPVLETGRPAAVPFAVPDGVLSRAWSLHGRTYVLLINAAAVPAALEPGPLKPWRALFEARCDPREALAPCGGGACLAPERTLWLEGRLLPEKAP
ncbi:MAG: hypothetical protein PHS14_12905 [Elusimicrobia bacterium]|nr:hypothetical protein [Elusimicrobiota bacterium]